MSEMNKPTEQPDLASASTSGIARRRMILASLGKGATVAATVAVPMNSLAAFGTLSVTADGKRCTVSGTMSMPHSTETTTALCEGWSPSYYSDITKWPNYSNSNPNAKNPIKGGTGDFQQQTKFSALFGGGSDGKLIDILQGKAGTSDEASWIAAVLNGTSGSLAEKTNFPYTAAQVIDFHRAGGTTAANALKFFQGYMETRMQALAAASQGPTFFQK